MAALRSLDLFSGIGGLTLALKGLCEPLLYCEIEPTAQAVLLDQMRRGGLPAAPICSDVRTLTPQRLRGHTTSLPNSLVGGFPCTGFSLFGVGAGFEDEQSGLFMDILRLLDLFSSIHYRFLENVPHFINVGMTRAAAELHTKRGFELRWCCCEAREVGAPQLRRRFFFIGVKAGAALPKALKFTDGGYRPFAARWHKEPRRTVCAADALVLPTRACRLCCAVPLAQISGPLGSRFVEGLGLTLRRPMAFRCFRDAGVTAAGRCSTTSLALPPRPPILPSGVAARAPHLRGARRGAATVAKNRVGDRRWAGG